MVGEISQDLARRFPPADTRTWMRDKQTLRPGLAQDLVGGIEIPFHEDGRNIERIRVVIETRSAASIRRKGIRRPRAYPEEVPNGVVVLRAAQPMKQDSTGIWRHNALRSNAIGRV